MKIAVVGATGLVGRNILKVLEERNFPVTEFIPVASERSSGTKVIFRNKEYTVCTPQQAVEKRPAIAIFSAGSEVSATWASKFAETGCYVIDNSAYWRMDPDKKLIIPEINAEVLCKEDHIIANPNCSTIQMLIAIADLHKKYTIKRIVVSTYQCITGTGKKAVDQMNAEREIAAGSKRYPENSIIGHKSPDGVEIPDHHAYTKAYPYQIDLNLLPHIDNFLESGYTKEEMKMVHETHKIMRDKNIRISPTAVRVPVLGGHAESINLEFEKPVELQQALQILKNTRGVILQDNVAPCGERQNPAIGKQIDRNSIAVGESSNKQQSCAVGESNNKKQSMAALEALPYPMPLYTKDCDEVFVGRVRLDPSVESGLNLWCVADNLRKGAATNAVQIAELLLEKEFCRC